ncbi:MAG: DUF362 domain-containing protein [candidate division WOR-3 bacterium]|nr:MAG: DUF362 domain-containing protein [candidate division WOR-3 bacterium]
MSDISRRDFIKAGLGFAAAAVLPKRLLGQEAGAAAGPAIGVARGNKTELVKAAVDLVGGIGKFVSQGDRVCIKPNISFAANVECGATTSVGITRQLVELCLEAGAAKVIILDHTIADAGLCVEKSGIRDAVADPKRVSLLTPDQERLFAEVEVPNGTELSSVKVAKAVLSADKLINLPTAKSHSATGVSLGIKGLMGLVWDRGFLHRKDLHKAIAELPLVIKPVLTVVDATRALTSGGPGGPGKTVELNTVVAGIDMIAVDSYAVGLTPWYNRSFTGRSVKHIAAAADLGLGEIDTAKMAVQEVKV